MYISISDSYITLGQLLKVADIIQSGGEAKAYLSEHTVQVNDKNENRRGRKLYPGDMIVASKKKMEIVQGQEKK